MAQSHLQPYPWVHSSNSNGNAHVAKPAADEIFTNFRPFIVSEYGKRSKQIKATAKSVGFGIANSVVAIKILDADMKAAEATWVVTKVANALQTAQDKQNECIMEMFKQLMSTMSTIGNGNPRTANTLARQTDPVGNANHANKANSSTQSLMPNAGSSKPMLQAILPIRNPSPNAIKTAEGVLGLRSQSSGSWER